MVVRDVVVAVTGAVVIIVAAVGVAVIESRAGPFEFDMEPALVPVQLGHLSVASVAQQGVQLVDGACLPIPPSLSCTPGEFILSLGLVDLPPLASPLGYVGILAGGSAAERPLGAFAVDANGHLLEYRGDHGDEGHDRVRVELATFGPGAATAWGLSVGMVPLSEPPQDLLFQGPSVSGSVTLHQIGAVTVSATIAGTVAGLPPAPAGTAYQAWLVDGESRHTGMGRLTPDAGFPSVVRLEGRVERVRLADQDTFLVTLEPVDSTAAVPLGFPVVIQPLWA